MLPSKKVKKVHVFIVDKLREFMYSSNMLDNSDEVYEYWTVDTHKDVKLKRYANFLNAMRAAERLNMEYGAVRYNVRVERVKYLDKLNG